VSRASKARSMRDGPSAMAASTNARFVCDFDPGTVTVPVTAIGA